MPEAPLTESVVIALDAMGGDNGPGVVVEGAVRFFDEMPRAVQKGVSVILTGERDTLARLLSRAGGRKLPISIQHASQVVGMDEHPSQALRNKPDSSLSVMAGLQKSGIANSMVSPGNTGAMMAASVFALGTIPGIQRPAIAGSLPTVNNPSILLDLGANVDCKPDQLFRFAFMGSVYSRDVFGVKNPRVALLNVGIESTKGTPTVQEVYRKLSESPLNFVGNLEGDGILKGEADVVVCDGFVGNVLLKFTESVTSLVGGALYLEMKRHWTSRFGYLFMKPSFNHLWTKLDTAEYGGAPLLGLNGVSIVAHGSSSSHAIRNALKVGVDFRRTGAVEKIRSSMAELIAKEKASEQ